jgi:hypothetical protein
VEDEGDTIAPSSVRSRTHWSRYSSGDEKKLDSTDVVLNDISGASLARVKVRFCRERWIWSRRVRATVRARLTKRDHHC